MFTELSYLPKLDITPEERSLDYSPVDIPTKYSLPQDVQFCKKCVISNQRPRIKFDEEGVCSACRYWEKKDKHIDWDERERELRDLCDRHRSRSGGFDVLVPSSGGKESVYIAHLLKTKYGMNPLTMTWAPHLYTEIGYRNFQAKIHAGFNNVSLYPDGEVHRRMTRISTVEIGDPFQPFIYGQTYLPLKVAGFYGINLIFDGENGDAEYGGDPTTEAATGFTLKDANEYWLSSFPIETWLDKGFSRRELNMYMPPKDAQIEDMGDIERHFGSYYLNWQPQSHYYYCVENTNFLPNPAGRSEGTFSKYASLDDLIDPMHYYLAVTKFGLGRCTSDAAHEIREGLIERDEGVALVQRYDLEVPSQQTQSIFKKYCDFDDEELQAVIAKWTNTSLWDGLPNKGGRLKVLLK